MRYTVNLIPFPCRKIVPSRNGHCTERFPISFLYPRLFLCYSTVPEYVVLNVYIFLTTSLPIISAMVPDSCKTCRVGIVNTTASNKSVFPLWVETHLQNIRVNILNTRWHCVLVKRKYHFSLILVTLEM